LGEKTIVMLMSFGAGALVMLLSLFSLFPLAFLTPLCSRQLFALSIELFGRAMQVAHAGDNNISLTAAIHPVRKWRKAK